MNASRFQPQWRHIVPCQKHQSNIFISIITKCFSVCLRGQILACVVEQLETADFFSESIPKSRLFVTVHDAVLHILKKQGQTDFILVSSTPCIFIQLISFSCQLSMFILVAQHSFFPPRMFPTTPRCDQQGSDCSNSRHLPPHPPPLMLMAAPLLTIGQSWTPPTSVGENALP